MHAVGLDAEKQTSTVKGIKIKKNTACKTKTQRRSCTLFSLCPADSLAEKPLWLAAVWPIRVLTVWPCSPAAACQSISITAGSVVKAQQVQARSSKKKKEKQLRGWGTFVSLRNEMTVVEAFVVFATLHLYYFLFPQALNYCFRKCHRWETTQQEACAHTLRFCLLLLRPRPSLVIQIHPGKGDWKKNGMCNCRGFHPGCFLCT